MLAAVYCGLLVIPIAATFQCQAGWPRWCMVAYTVVLALLPLAGLAALLLSPRLRSGGLSVQGFVLGLCFDLGRQYLRHGPTAAVSQPRAADKGKAWQRNMAAFPFRSPMGRQRVRITRGLTTFAE